MENWFYIFLVESVTNCDGLKFFQKFVFIPKTLYFCKVINGIFKK